MSRFSDLVMSCDRCGKREVLKNTPLPSEKAENDEARTRMARWHSLRTQDMGGDTEWDYCPDCFTEFIHKFTKGSK